MLSMPRIVRPDLLCLRKPDIGSPAESRTSGIHLAKQRTSRESSFP